MRLFKKKDKQQKEGISGVKIHVVINRLMSDITPVVVAEFDAEQQKDQNFNFQIVNEDANFREELSVIKERALDYLNYKLELKGKSKDEAIALINEKIKKLDNQIKKVENGKLPIYEGLEKKKKKVDGKEKEVWVPKQKVSDDGKPLFEKVNKIDMENELSHYKVLKFNIETKGEGSYERVNANGDREIQFATIEGVLYPYFWRSNKDKDSRLLLYPDMVSKRKFYKEASDRVTEDLLRSNQGFFSGIKGILATIAVVLLIISGVILNIRGAQRWNEAEQEIMDLTKKYRVLAQDNAVECAYYYAKLIEDEIINKSIMIPTSPPEEKKPITDMVKVSETLVS